MKLKRYLLIGGLAALLFAAGHWPGGSLAWAEESGEKTFKERKHERAGALREQAKENARAGLGYGNVYTPELNRDIDFYSIGLQIKRLGTILQSLAGPGPGQTLIPIPLQGRTGSGEAGTGSETSVSPGVARVYGPDGPTEKSVRLMLEYRLMVSGNPRLAVGEVKEEDKRIIANVVTIDGSLVEKYSIDKKTGIWVPIR